jgi:hypothetical protein
VSKIIGSEADLATGNSTMSSAGTTRCVSASAGMFDLNPVMIYTRPALSDLAERVERMERGAEATQ